MVNPRFNSIDEYQDLETRNKYINLKNKGGNLEFFEIKNNRDNSRTPFQWDDTINSGFSSENPG
jgi:oligo-1,6-glucosidase